MCVCVCVYTRDWAQYFLFSRSHSKDGPHCQPYLPFLFWDRVLLSGLGWRDTSYVVQTGAKCDSPALLSSAAGVAVLHHQAQIHLPFKASSLISKWLPQLMHSVYYSIDDHRTTWALQLTLFFSTSFESCWALIVRSLDHSPSTSLPEAAILERYRYVVPTTSFLVSRSLCKTRGYVFCL